MEQLLPLEIKEKINFINSNFQQIETKKIYIDIISNLNDIFDYLNKNSNDQIYKIFLFELKNKIRAYIDDQKKFLLSNKNFFETSNLKEKYFVSKLSDEVISNIISISKNKINLIRENIKKKKLERFDLTINGGIYILRIIRILNKEFKDDDLRQNFIKPTGSEDKITFLSQKKYLDNLFLYNILNSSILALKLSNLRHSFEE